MKKIAILAVLALSFSAVAQVQYEPGYLINDQGQKQNVLILNRDWRSNPTEFSYKLSESGHAVTGNLATVREFGVGDYLKYKKSKVSIDRSSEQLREMSAKPEPEFSEETVFLKQLVEGEVDLYVYEEGALERYFVSNDQVGTIPLVHKKFLKDSRISTNNQFRQQLYNLASCGEITPMAFNKTEYESKDLIAYLGKYHDCRQKDYHVFREEGKKVKLNFAVKAGVDLSNFKVKKGIYVKGYETDLDPSLRIGAELEAVMPFNRNKWAVFIEPTLSSQKIEKEHIVSNEIYNKHEVDLSVDYKFLTLVLGGRHYLFLNNHSKLFFSAGVGIDVPFKTSVLIDRDERYEYDPELDETTAEAYGNLGLGFKYKRLGAELSYSTPKKVWGSSTVLSNYELDWESSVSSLTLMFSYRIF